MAYALVQDLPLSWEEYERIARQRREHVPAGLIVHLAGPTDEGVRVIDIWDSERSSRIAEGDRTHGVASLRRASQPDPTVRDLHGLHLVVGPAAATDQSQPVEQRSRS